MVKILQKNGGIMSKVKVCEYCKAHNNIDEIEVYFNYLEDDVYTCPNCGNNLTDTVMDEEDSFILCNISRDQSFLESMILLKEKDLIEYQLKMSQFKYQCEQHKNENVPRCPTCGSTDIEKITGLSKVGSVALWGILSRKVHKQWHCNSCGSEW